MPIACIAMATGSPCVVPLETRCTPSIVELGVAPVRVGKYRRKNGA